MHKHTPTTPAALPARLYTHTDWDSSSGRITTAATPTGDGVNVPHRATFTFAADTDSTTELARRIVAYLPHGWYIHTVGRDIGIYGNDHAGWTLHDYVLPRLASGCIYPVSITPEATQ